MVKLIDLKGTPYNSCFISLHPGRTTILLPAVVLNVFHICIVRIHMRTLKMEAIKTTKNYMREWSP